MLIKGYTGDGRKRLKTIPTCHNDRNGNMNGNGHISMQSREP